MEDILGYVLDTLDREEQDAIEARMERDPAFREEVEACRRRTLPLADDDYIDPPTGLATRTLAYTRHFLMSPSERDWAEAKPRMRLIDFAVAATVLIATSMLVLPAIATLRGDQSRVLCAEQLRNLGIALAMYADQEAEHFPTVDADGLLNNAGSFSMRLKAHQLIPDNGQTLICPSANSAIVMVPDMDEFIDSQANTDRVRRLRKHMAGSYGYTLGFERDGVHTGAIYRHDQRPVVSDRPPRAEEVQFFNSPNHQDRGQNVLYADGNVRWMPSRIVGRDDLFRNNQCQIGAGLSPMDIVIGVSESTPYSHVEL